MVARFICSLLIAGFVACPLAERAAAEGAFAVGVSDDVAKDGLAYGTATNYKTVEEARAVAMRHCRTFKDAPIAAKYCRVVSTVDRLCFALAFDPKITEPGVGWAIARTAEEAASRAVEDCRAASISSRREFCKTDIVRCDGETPKQ